MEKRQVYSVPLLSGVTPDSVAQTLFTAFGNRQVSTINTATNEYYVILEVSPELQKDPSALDRLYVRANTGKLIPLSAVTASRAGRVFSPCARVPSSTRNVRGWLDRLKTFSAAHSVSPPNMKTDKSDDAGPRPASS